MSDIDIRIRLSSKAAEQGLKGFGAAANVAGQRLTFFEKVTRQANRSLDSFFGNLGANLAFRAFNGIIRGIGETVTNIREFERALVGVGKTTGLAGQELEQIGFRIENLSKSIPVASTELLDLTKTAAQLGIRGTDNLEKFTETLSRLSFATDIIGEEGALAFARIINVTGESVGNIDRLGSSIVALGNNFATTERQIITVANEVAKGGARFGITANEVLALSTTMSSLGTEAQVAGSTIQKTFSLIEKAIGNGGTELQRFADIVGVSNEEFIRLFETDPTELFIRLNEGLADAVKGGANLSKTLAGLGLVDLRVTKTLGPLITRTDELRRATELANKAYEENQALLAESEAAFNTLDGDLQKLENSWIALTNSLLRALLPAIIATVQAFTDIINFVTETSVVMDTLFLGTLLLVGKQLIVVNGLIAAQIAQLGGLSIALTSARIAATLFWAAFGGPVTAVVAGLGLVALATRKIVETTEQERLSYLEAARERKRINGQSTQQIDEQIRKIKTRIQLEEQNTATAKRGRAGINTVLRSEIKNTRDLNAELFKQVGFRVNLNKIAGLPVPSGVLRSQEELNQIKQTEKDKELAERESNQRRLAQLREFGELKNQIELERLEAEFLLDEELSDQEKLKLQQRADSLATQLEDEQLFLARRLGLNEEAAKLELKNEAEQGARSNAIRKTIAENNEKARQEELKQREDFLNTATTLARSENKTLAAIGKAAAITQIAIKTPPAVANSYEFGTKFGGPVLGAVFAGIASAAMAAQAAQVAGLSFQDGGIVPGTSFSGDRVQANVNSGEMILNRQQQAQLFDIANGGGEDGRVIEVTSVVQIDETEIARAVSRQVAQGFAIGEGGV